MKVVILCGGFGTRLREETEFRPKPLVEIGGKPILWHIMKIYAHHGLREFILCLGYRGGMIKEYFLNYEAMNNDFNISLGRRNGIEYLGAHAEQDFRVTLADTGLETMTGGRVKRVEQYVDGETFVVTYGDGVGDIDIRALIDFHHSHGKLATVTAARLPSRFGVVELDADGSVLDFSEKPLQDNWINVGFFVFNRRVFDYLTDDACVLEREPLEILARERQLVAYRHSGFWHQMDTYRDSQTLNKLWAEAAPWRIW